MSAEDLEDYEEFKSTILRVYELRLEVYRLHLRGARKKPTDTYGDCARYLEETLEKWLLSEDVDPFISLKKLILIEHFTNLADKEIRTKIKEKRFRTVREASTSGDRVFALRASGAKPVSVTPFTHDKHASGAVWGNKSSYQGKEKKEGDKSYQAKSPPSSFRFTCFYFKQEGHIKPNCANWKATQIPKLVAPIMGSGKSSEEGFECSRGDNGVLDSLGGSLQCFSIDKASVSSPC